MRFVQLKYIGQHLKERPKPTIQLQIKKPSLSIFPSFFCPFMTFIGLSCFLFLSVSSFLLNFPLNNLDSPLVQERVSLVSLVPFPRLFRQPQLHNSYFLAVCS